MTADLITLTHQRIVNSPLKDFWSGSMTAGKNTRGGGLEDEIALIDARGFGQIGVTLADLQTLAGTLRFYAVLENPTTTIDPTVAAVKATYRTGQLGDDIAVGADGIKYYYFDAVYSYILVTFAKTAAGATTAHVIADAVGSA